MALPPANTEAGASIRGILLMMAAVSFFGCLDATAKWLSASMPSIEIVWLRYASHCLLIAIAVRAWRDWSAFSTRRPFMQFLRGMTLLGSTFFNFWALRYLQLAEASAIMFASPLLLTALAGPMLGEKVGLRRWLAIIVGFIGVLVVLRPGTGTVHWAAGLSICGMVCYTFYAIMTRMMHKTETSLSMLMLSGLVGVVILAPVGPASVDHLVGWQWLLAILMGGLGAIGHYCLTLAHAYAPASTLAPFTYAQMLWMIVLGYLIFHQFPDAMTLVGIAIICGAGLYILHRERVRGQAITPRDGRIQ